MSFSQDIANFAKKVGKSKEETTGAILFKLNELVVTRTPVDTGRARGGWIASVDTPSATSGETADKNGSRTLTRANGVAAMAVGRVYYLVNNVRYIMPLEFGSSKQAPAGMARISIEELRNWVRSQT